YEIDEISYRISTLESKHRLNVAEIKKDIVNIDVKGDYKKYLESLEIDYKIANNNYQTRIKKLNVLSLYSQKVQDIYKKSSELNKELEINLLDTELNKIINQKESLAHKDYYNNLINQFNAFYSYQTKLSEAFLKIVKLNLLDNTKRVNYYYSKKFYYHKDRLEDRINNASNQVIQYIKNSQVKIDINNNQTDTIIGYLNSSKKRYSHLTYIEKSRLGLLKKLDENEKNKISKIKNEILTNYRDKNKQQESTKTRINKSIYFFKRQLLLLESNSLAKILKLNQHSGYYKNVLWIITQIHYDLINYSYNYHSTKNIIKLNNLYDDFIVDFTKKSISIFDKINNKKTKKIPTLLKEYLIFAIEKQKKALQKYFRIIQNISDERLNVQIKEIAYTKINTNNHKNIIEKEFDKIAEKSVKIRDNSRKQQENIQKKAYKLNNYLEKQVKNTNDNFINKKAFTDNKISYIKNHIKKQINQNDKKLVKMLKEFDQSIYENQMNLKKDYYIQMKMLNNLKNKIDIDFQSESKFIEAISSTYIDKINLTQDQLKTQLNIIPSERQAALANLNSNKKSFFRNHQNQLLAKYKEIEKIKFTKIPELEEKIKEETSTITEEYQVLNDKHIEKEKIFLNKYTLINEKYQQTYNNYLKNKTKKEFNIDKLLDQPLKDISDVQSSLISKSNIIFSETENKTNQTVSKINDDKLKSENKQKRIINS
ncbi:MAG: hypothetical protein K9L64_06660, partial [Candidatus Izimaplasma sp.]|nr:hypothetical protein [Candidatus Izimaplasma bacterium]